VSTAIVEKLRETIERAMPRQQAASSMFAALARFGSRVPADEDELAEFVRGPLKEELTRALDASALAGLVRDLDAVLANAGAPTADRASIPIEVEVVVEDVPPRWADEVTTASFRAVEGPVPVLVIARSGSLASRLRMSLGEHVIDVEARADAHGVERALGAAPVIAIVDARDAGTMTVETLADALVRASKTTVIVWGTDSPYGRSVVDAVDERGGAITGVATSEGVGAIFDLVISRRT
jgi:hypothetical protein